MTPLFQVAPQTLGESACPAGLSVHFDPVRRAWIVRWRNGKGKAVEVECSPEGSVIGAAPAAGEFAVAADTAAWAGRPAGFLAGAEAAGVRAALRSGRRIPGVPPRFPSAAPIFCLEQSGVWEDLGWVEERLDAEIGAAALAGEGGRWLIAYLVRGESQRYLCRVAVVPREAAGSDSPAWRKLPAYPAPPGRAGAMAGTHGKALIVAGGANFPDLMPWEGGTKRYYDDIYVLVPGETKWRAAGRLPAPRAYGAVVSTARGLLLLGGEDAGQVFSDSLLLSWNGRELSVEPGPPLPEPATSAAAVMLEGFLYLAGGYHAGTPRLSRHDFWRRAWNDPAASWTRLDSWPGPARAMAVMAALQGAVYLMSGLEVRAPTEPAESPHYLRDAYRYRPGAGWERLPDLPWSAVAAPSPAPVTAVPPRIFVLGGVDGTQVGHLPRETPLPDDILSYDVARNEWTLWPGPWPTPVVTVPAVALDGEWAIVSGEIKPGNRTTEAWAWRPAP